MAAARAHDGAPMQAIAMHGEAGRPVDFSHFAYVNPEAPKGGRFTQAIVGTFDSLNPFIVKGLPVDQVRGYVIESLMARDYDAPFTLYGLLARTVETDPQRDYVEFALDPTAMFSDGVPVTAADVIFSWQLLRDHGRPNLRTYYKKVVRAEAVDQRTVRFDLAGADDRELPLILGLMPILAEHAVDPLIFETTSLSPPIGSGPYLVTDVHPGASVTFKRNRAYWGRRLPVNVGLWNFDEIRLEYYRDSNSEFEAFQKGLSDVRLETDPGRWTTAYDFPAVRDQRVVKEALPTGLPRGMSAFVFNTRRPLFADIRVREAIGLLFDFEWLNRNFFFGLYQRTGSYFEGSELSSSGHPASARERELLAPFPGTVRPEVLAGTWRPPVSDGSGRDRRLLKQALALLTAAGFELSGTHLRHRSTGQPLTFEILVATRQQERLALTFARDLERAGILARVRLVDSVQYDQRRQTFDFDMIQFEWSESLSPGNEQSFYWGAAAADEPGSRNYMGVRNSAVDAMIVAMLGAEDRGDFIAAVRALDRVLISGFYVVPLFHLHDQWIARWARIERPARTSLFGYLPETWWTKTSDP
ncbi:MAG TPA: extracellular solute-binding protein [Xanthobacteraceae bacterium]|nr:extracellular solute-binding protein [Xanthobacteraceae bacterium]